MDLVIPSPDRIKADVEHLKDWISKEPHLPTIDDEEWLKTFLYANKFRLEKTKYKLDNYYSLRVKYPEYFTNRDPTGEDLLQFRPLFKHCTGHKLLKDGSQVLYDKITGDPGLFDPTAYLKRSFMHADLLCLDPANRLNYHVRIIDCGHIKPMHLLKLAMVQGREVEIYYKAYTFRTKGIHLINFPSFEQKFLAAAFSFISEKIRKRIRIHKTTDTLLEVVDEDVLCSDYGGKGLSLEYLEDQALKRLEEARDWFKKQENLCSNEALRRKDPNRPEEIRGSFRKLDVD